MKKQVIRLHPDDNVAVALVNLSPGEHISLGDSEISVRNFIGFGHKVALENVNAGGKIYRNRMSIGSATRDISVGEHVHLHNLQSDYIETLNNYYAGRRTTE